MTVSIICASYNYGRFLKETIESVINQTYTNWELVIVDDGSSDNSLEIIKSYCEKDDRIKLFYHKNHKNRGLKETLKLGVKYAQGQWLVFLESDDMLKPDYISKKLRILNSNPQLDMLFSGLEILGSKAVEANFNAFFRQRNELIKDDFKIEYMLDKNFVPTFSCVMIKKHVFESLNFNTPVPQILDWWLWAQVLAQFCTGYVDENLSIWRMHKSSYISSIDEKNMCSFKESLFDFIFEPSDYFLPRLLLKLYLLSDSIRVKKLFGTPARNLRSKIISNLNKINDIKTSFYYFNN